MPNNLPHETAQALVAHQQAKTLYLQHQERLQTLAQRAERLKKTAEASQEQAYTDGQSWRTKLREHDGELTKEIQKLRQDAIAAEQLANEYQLMASEVEQEQEVERFAIEQVRKKYGAARTEARISYARTLQANAVKNLLATDIGQEFLRVFGVAGLIPQTGAIQHSQKPSMRTTQQLEAVQADLGARLIQILDELATVVPCHTLDGEHWGELEAVTMHPTEEHPAEIRQSMIKKMRRQTEIAAARQERSA